MSIMMYLVKIALLLFCCVCVSTAISAQSTSTSAQSTSVTTETVSATTALSNFWWSRHGNSSKGGYYPVFQPCDSLGSSCEDACGTGARQCGTEGNDCYFPDLGDQCCDFPENDLGYAGACYVGYKCALAGNSYRNFFCCFMGETEDECASIEQTPVLTIPDIRYITVTPSVASFSGHPDTVTTVQTVYMTPTSNPVPIPTLTKSPSSSKMTTGAKIGVGISVPVAVIALGLLGTFLWFRRRHPYSVPQESEKLAEGSGQDQSNGRRSHEPDPQRASYLQVSPLSPERQSMITASTASLSPNVNYSSVPSVPNIPSSVNNTPAPSSAGSPPSHASYTPIPISDLPELVEGPSK